MVGVALPSIQADLGLTTSQLQWVVSAYVLGLGGVLLLGGRASDLLGRRRVLIGALVGLHGRFAGRAASWTTATLLIVARFLKGVAAAFTVPAALSLITTTFTEGPARNKALAIFNAFGASGFSFGLVFGGLLTSADWRLTFLLPVPVAAILLAVMPRYIAQDRPVPRPQAPLRHPGRAAADRGDAAARAHDRRGARDRLGRGRDASAASCSPSACSPPSWPSSAAPPSRSCGSASSAPAPLVRANLGAMCPVRRLRRLPVRGHPVPAEDARLERARDRAGLPARRPARRLRRAAHGRRDQPLRHREADPGLDDRLRARLRAVPADRRDAVLARRSCPRCCWSGWASRSATRR